MIARWTFAIAVGLWLAALAGLKLLIVPPIPASVLAIYMALATVAIAVFVAADEKRLRHFLSPMKAVFAETAPRIVRIPVVVGLPLLLAWATYLRTAPTDEAPFEPRVVHPEPPSEVAVRGRKVPILGLKNPARGTEAEVAARVAEGKTLYFRNCFFCHGDALAGDGHFARAFRPIPANFRDVGTISMLQESYVFWRIATGGPGLPRGAAPWSSAMPVWQDFLAEDEIWKVILYIYAGSGSTPRTWDADASRPHTNH